MKHDPKLDDTEELGDAVEESQSEMETLAGLYDTEDEDCNSIGIIRELTHAPGGSGHKEKQKMNAETVKIVTKEFDREMGASIWIGKTCAASLGLSGDFTNESDMDDETVRKILKGILQDNGLHNNLRGGWVSDGGEG